MKSPSAKRPMPGDESPPHARTPPSTAEAPSTLDLLFRDVGAIPVLSREEERRKTRRFSESRAAEQALIGGMPSTARLLQRCLRSDRSVDLRTAWRRTPPDPATRASIDRSLRQRLSSTPSTTARSQEVHRAWDAYESRLGRYLESLDLRSDFYDDAIAELQACYEDAADTRSARTRLRDSLPYPLSRLDQRIRELERARACRDEARNDLARHNIKLVVRCAKSFRGLGLAFPDLIQEGTLGLLRAIDLFEPERGFKLSTYSVWWIRQSMVRAVQRTGRTVRLPSHVNDALQKLGKAEEALSHADADPLDDTTLSSSTGLAPDRVRRLRVVRQPAARMDARLGADNDRTLHDLLAAGGSDGASERIERLDREALAARLLAQLPPFERRLVSRRFGLDDSEGTHASLSALTKEFGMSRESLRRRENAALERMRDLAFQELHGDAPSAVEEEE